MTLIVTVASISLVIMTEVLTTVRNTWRYYDKSFICVKVKSSPGQSASGSLEVLYGQCLNLVSMDGT